MSSSLHEPSKEKDLFLYNALYHSLELSGSQDSHVPPLVGGNNMIILTQQVY